MFKRTALLGHACSFLCFSSSWAWDDYNAIQTYVSALNQQDPTIVHGYYPKQFSLKIQIND